MERKWGLTKIFTVSLISILLSNCTKSADNKIVRPAPLNFELVGADGQSLVASVKERVEVTFIQNGIQKEYKLKVIKLQRTATDTTASAKYNGLVITDDTFLSNLSSADNPVHLFNISLNGNALGAIYLNYPAYLGANPKTSTTALTFNNIPVNEDRGGGYFTAGSNINLLQVK